MAEDARARYVATKLTEKRWKQADLVRETGLDKNTISDFMTGKRAPSTATLVKIEDALELTPGTLTGGGEDSSGRPFLTDDEIAEYERRRTGAAYLSDEELLAELNYRFRRLKRENETLASGQQTFWDELRSEQVKRSQVKGRDPDEAREDWPTAARRGDAPKSDD